MKKKFESSLQSAGGRTKYDDAFYHLRNISHIRKLLSTKTTETLVHAFVTSKLDHCNSLLYGVPKYVIQKLQSVQNAAARLITSSRKFDRITPVLFDLHWLPISERIKFKIILLTHKALHQQSPTYIKDLIRRYSTSRTLRSSSTLRLTPVNFNLMAIELLLFLPLNCGINYPMTFVLVTI